jgi:hypothetical protein
MTNQIVGRHYPELVAARVAVGGLIAIHVWRMRSV